MDFISLLKKKDKLAFKELVTTYQDLIYNTLLSFVKNESDAEDLTQEVFVKVFHALPEFKEKSKLSTWLYKLAVNSALEYLRKKKRRRQLSVIFPGFKDETENVSDFVHPGILLENQERSKILEKVIDGLPQKQMTAFRLREYQSLSYDEISKIMNASVSSVESLLFRAKKNLRERLEKYYINIM